MMPEREPRLDGRASPAFKYDLLTALGAHACASAGHRGTLALRLMVLVTARYDWRADMLATGQREMAALWSVDERTVKREVARLREMGWLVLKRPAARGRVACHGLGIAAILADTRGSWDAVGQDFVARLTVPQPASDTVVAFPTLETRAGPWGRVAVASAAADPATHLAWIAPLRCDGMVDGQLILRAPSAFHAAYVRTHLAGLIERHARREFDGVAGIDLRGP